MIKFAVTRPAKRKEDIEHGLKLLNWDNDPYLRNYGMKISSNMIETKARLLTAPIVKFGPPTNKTETPKAAGRWRVDGKQFLTTNTANNGSLAYWGVCVVNDIGG
jgi:eukaryotic translation initiation factor 2C